MSCPNKTNPEYISDLETFDEAGAFALWRESLNEDLKNDDIVLNDKPLEYKQLDIPLENQELENTKDFVDKAEVLQSTFKEYDVELVPDKTMEEKGAIVIKENGKITIKYNPDKATKDTIIHEYGHLFIEILGMEHPLVQSGLKMLKGTAIENFVLKNYPELTGEDFNKEVLATAIGLKGAELYDGNNKPLFLKWLDLILDKISGLVGVKKDSIKELATVILSGKTLDKTELNPGTFKSKEAAVDALVNKSNKITLNSDLHTYIYEDKIVPNSVTGVISSLYPFGDTYSEVLKAKWAERTKVGSNVHEAINNIIEGKTVDYTKFSDSEFLESVKKIIQEERNKGSRILSEIKIYDDFMNIAGSIDLLIVRPDGKTLLYDFKTSAEQLKATKTIKFKKHSLQVKMYAKILENQGIKVDNVFLKSFIK